MITKTIYVLKRVTLRFIDRYSELPMRFRSRSFPHFPYRSLQMSQLKDKQRGRRNFLDVLSRIIKTQRGLSRKGFVYCKIQPIMTSEKDDTCDLSDVNLQENSDAETQVYIDFSTEECFT